MLKRLGSILFACMFAASVSATAANASVSPPPVGVDAAVMIPIACVFVLPLLMSISLQRELTGEELTATTLMCFTGPLGYFIATENGWIGPEFFRGGGS